MSPSVWLPTPSAVSVSSARLLPTTHNHWKQNLVCGPLCDPGLGTSAIDLTLALVHQPLSLTLASVQQPLSLTLALVHQPLTLTIVWPFSLLCVQVCGYITSCWLTHVVYCAMDTLHNLYNKKLVHLCCDAVHTMEYEFIRAMTSMYTTQ